MHGAPAPTSACTTSRWTRARRRGAAPPPRARSAAARRGRAAGAEPAPRTITGTVTAAGGHSLKDTVVIACPQGDGDSDAVKDVVIGDEGATATFALQDLDDVPYALYAVQDTDGNRDLNAGDWVDRALSEERQVALVRVGTADVRLELVEVR